MQCFSCLLVPVVLSFAPPAQPDTAKAKIKEDALETTVAVGDYGEAMDALGKRMLKMAKKGKVLCIWLFDESESMKDDQKEVQVRIPKLYAALKNGGAEADRVVSVIASYGERTRVYSERPTSDVKEISRQLDRIPIDKSGKEEMCPAIGGMIVHHRRIAAAAERQMVLVLVTDESGERTSNLAMLEPALKAAKDAGCRVFVFGREAMFGSPYAYFPWIEPRTKLKLSIRIDRGPETPFAELLQTDGFRQPPASERSGFGPYEQSRFAKETGGAFFMLPSANTDLAKRAGAVRDRGTLNKYAPSLGSREDYVRARAKSRVQNALWAIITGLNPHDPERAKLIQFRTRFSIDVKPREAQLDKELGKVEGYVKYLDAAAESLEKLRADRLTENRRWRANFDLIHAQVVAYRIRIDQYRRALTAFQKTPKKPEEKSPDPRKTETFWGMKLRQEIIKDPNDEAAVDKQIERATKLFQRVIEDHQGTPWASRARWELSRGFGIELRQVWQRPPVKDPIRPPPL